MQGTKYCLQEPILSVMTASAGQRECVYVPAGEVISVSKQDPLDKQFVEVSWEAKTVLMFQQDLRERAEVV